MYFVKMVPRRIDTVQGFEARDPWNHDAPGAFSLDLYKMVSEHITEPTRLHTLGQPELFGLRSAIDGSEHLLPHFLSDLWRAGRVPAELLPALLRAIEGQLVKRDYFPPPLRSFAVAAALGLAVALPATLVRLSLADVRNAQGGLLLLAALTGWTVALSCGLGLPFLWLRRRRAARYADWALAAAAQLRAA